MSIEIDYLKEPKLQFGSYFEHEDPKTGLREFGPFGKNIAGLHPSEIKLGIIGTRETISGAREWIDQCTRAIESENIEAIKAKIRTHSSLPLFDQGRDDKNADEGEEFFRAYKILNPDFVGFSAESPFESQIELNERWERAVHPVEIKRILSFEDKRERIEALVNLFEDQIKSLSQTKPSPDVVILALTSEMEEKADVVQISGNFFLNFRRAMKARAMKWEMPTQLLRQSTVLGKRSRRLRKSLQEKATRAWNFCTGLYYKADGVPWRPLSLEQDTCYVGISFYVAQEPESRLTMRSSVAQAFDYLGQGLILRGDPFEWDEERYGLSPHMPKEAARVLIRRTLDEYIKVCGNPPKRVVIHKSSRFWGDEHPEFDEMEGFSDGIYEVFPGSQTDFVTLSQTGIRLFREGMYPPLRGTYFNIDDEHFLYTMGFIPYLETYPGPYVPEPWQIVEHHGGSAPKDLLREVLELTKLNVNNCSFADGFPITMSFSRKVGEIMKHIGEGEEPRPGYKYYM